MKQSYLELPGFEFVFLEESFVTDVVARPSSVRFSCSFVLTEHHPLYFDPRPNEFYCYLDGILLFEGVSALEWVNQATSPWVDASGELDYGNIDSLEFESNQYFLEGDWGAMTVSADRASIRFEKDESTPAKL